MAKVLEFIYNDRLGFCVLDLPRRLDEWTSKVASFVVGSGGLSFPALLQVGSRVNTGLAYTSRVIWIQISASTVARQPSKQSSRTADIFANVGSADTGFVVFERDSFQQAVEVATGYILLVAHTPGF